MRILFGVVIVILGMSCSNEKTKNSTNIALLTNVNVDSILRENEPAPDEFALFRAMIDSIYPEIVKRDFDTLLENGISKNTEIEKHRMFSIIQSKNQFNSSDLESIIGLYSCILKHNSIRKKNSEDLVVDEYVFLNAAVASEWFTKIYNCYHDYNNPLGEPLKEPYKLWQSENKIIHVYTRAEMWRSDMEAINKALMKKFAFTNEK